MSNYNKQIFKQFEELTIKFDNLTIKFQELKIENECLIKVNEKLLTKISFLETENIKKDKEILRLKSQIDKDSSNSSKPPSSNGFKKISNSREKSSKNSGGQPGHKGHCLKLPENFEELVASGKIEKNLVDHTNGAKNYITKWIIDVEFKTVYTEHRFPLSTSFDVKSSVIYGKNLKSLSVLLSNKGIIARERLSDFFSEVSNGLIKLSDATIESFNFIVSEKVDIEALKTELLNGKVIHVDETPLRCAQTLNIDEKGLKKIETAKNSTFNAVIRTHSNDKTTLYTVNPKKDNKGVKRDNILTRFCGIFSHDHDKKFYRYGNLHATCGAHLSRDLKGLSELYHLSWAKSFRSFYLGLNSYKKATKYCDPEKLSKFEQKYDKLLESGNAELEKMKPKFVDKKLGANSKIDVQELRVKSKLEVNSGIDIQKLGAKLKLEINSKTDIQELRVKSKLDVKIKPKFGFRELKTMLKRLTKYKDNYLLFLRNYTAPFTNNLAERDLRPCKTKQKISGCFRTWEGLNCFARIRSFISTAKKNSLNVLEMIKKLVEVGFVSEG